MSCFWFYSRWSLTENCFSCWSKPELLHSFIVILLYILFCDYMYLFLIVLPFCLLLLLLLLLNHCVSLICELAVWQLLDIGSLSHDVTADGSIMLSTGPLSMTVDAESLAPMTSTSADALNMAVGRHLGTKWPPSCLVCSEWSLLEHQSCSSHTRFAAFWFLLTRDYEIAGREKRIGKWGTEAVVVHRICQ